MQPADVHMMERERPALDEPANKKKPKLQKDGDSEHDEWSGWCTMDQLVQLMGTDFGGVWGLWRLSVPSRWVRRGLDGLCVEEFLITDQTIKTYYKKKKNLWSIDL